MRFASAFACVLCLVSLTAAPAIAQDAGGAAPPQPAPPAASELPPVDVIQKKAAPAPKAAQKKSAPKKTGRRASAAAGSGRAGADAEPVPGTGGIDSGTVNMSPVAGSEIPIAKYPAAVGRASQHDIAKFQETSVPRFCRTPCPASS